MIKVSGLKENQSRFVRETTAPFIISSDGKEETVTIRVQYLSHSIKRGREIQDEINKKSGEVYMSDVLLPVLFGLPDFVDAKDKPVKITKDFLDTINSVNLTAIHKAIGDDLAPKA